jgi:hypothetical protein
MIFNVAPVALQNQLSSERPDLANEGVKYPLMNEIRCFTADLGQKKIQLRRLSRCRTESHSRISNASINNMTEVNNRQVV